MQNITQPTEPTNMTNAQPTLADLITTYRADLAEQQRQHKEASDARVQEHIERLQRQLQSYLSPDLRECLQFDVRRSIQRYGSEMAEAYFSVDGMPWSIWHDGEDWHIEGPKGYQAHAWPLDDSAILGAIDHYPAWHEREQQRLQEQASKQHEPAHYTSTEGEHVGRCLLHRGAYVTVWYAAYDPREQGAAWGTVEAWDKRWLLLADDQGRQSLIAWRHVSTVEPRSKTEERRQEQSATADSDAESAAATAANDLEEIPF